MGRKSLSLTCLVVAFSSTALAQCSGCAWCGESNAEPPQGATHIAIVTDRSNGIEDGSGKTCGAVKTLAEAALRKSGSFSALSIVGEKTELMLFGTGDEAHPATPATLRESIKAPKKQRTSMETGPEEAKRAYAKDFAERVDKLHEACAGMTKTPLNASPIHATVVAAVGWLGERLTDPNNDGVLIIQSDLEEMTERDLSGEAKAAMTSEGDWAEIKKKRKAPLEAIAKKYSIDLRGRIRVYLCGAQENMDSVKKGTAHLRNVTNLWKEFIFKNPKPWGDGVDIREVGMCEGYGAIGGK